MKKWLILLMFLLSINVFAVSPSYFVGKTYSGDLIAENGSRYSALYSFGDVKLDFKFKNGNTLDFIIHVIPNSDEARTLMALSGLKESDLTIIEPIKYKIKNDTLILIDENGEDEEVTIVRDGEALIVDESDKQGISAILTLVKK